MSEVETQNICNFFSFFSSRLPLNAGKEITGIIRVTNAGTYQVNLCIVKLLLNNTSICTCLKWVQSALQNNESDF